MNAVTSVAMSIAGLQTHDLHPHHDKGKNGGSALAALVGKTLGLRDASDDGASTLSTSSTTADVV